MKLQEGKSEFSVVKEDFAFSGASLIGLLEVPLSRGLPFRFKVKGFSMSPFIKDGDIVTVVKPGISSIEIGTPAAFIHPASGKLVLHRVIGKRHNAYLIKGDNLLGINIVPEVNILGCVVRVERNGREVSFGLGRDRQLVALFSRLRILPFISWGLRSLRLPAGRLR